MARRDSKQAVKKAEAANQLAAAANDISAESNRIAVEANELSEQANAISERTAVLNEERNDVAWDYEWEGPGQLRLTQVGQDEAHAVRVRGVVSGETQLAERESVAAGEFIDLEFAGAREEELAYERAVRENEELRNSGDPFGPVLAAVNRLPLTPIHQVAIRVSWQTKLGQHRSTDL